jgi:hypothetical protein
MQRFPRKYSVGRLLRGLGSKRPLDEREVRAEVAALVAMAPEQLVLPSTLPRALELYNDSLAIRPAGVARAHRMILANALARFVQAESAEPSCRPIIAIGGFPRTGSSFLQRLLCSFEGAGYPMITDLLPHASSSSFWSSRVGRWLDPNMYGLSRLHPSPPGAPEELVWLTTCMLAGVPSVFCTDNEDYYQYIASIDRLDTDRFARLLGLFAGRRRVSPSWWVLKSPTVFLAPGTMRLLEEWPHGCERIALHRSPEETIPSMIGLCLFIASIVAPRAKAADVTKFLLEVADRVLAPPLMPRWREIPWRHISSTQLITRPVDIVLEIYKNLGLPPPPADDVARKAEQVRAQETSHMKYELSDFGLDVATIRRRYAEYYDFLATLK